MQRRHTCGIELTFWCVLLVPQLAIPYTLARLMLHLSTLFLMRIDYMTYHGPCFAIFLIPFLSHALHLGQIH